jgi:hypothetical protein
MGVRVRIWRSGTSPAMWQEDSYRYVDLTDPSTLIGASNSREYQCLRRHWVFASSVWIGRTDTVMSTASNSKGSAYTMELLRSKWVRFPSRRFDGLHGAVVNSRYETIPAKIALSLSRLRVGSRYSPRSTGHSRYLAVDVDSRRKHHTSLADRKSAKKKFTPNDSFLAQSAC